MTLSPCYDLESTDLTLGDREAAGRSLQLVLPGTDGGHDTGLVLSKGHPLA